MYGSADYAAIPPGDEQNLPSEGDQNILPIDPVQFRDPYPSAPAPPAPQTPAPYVWNGVIPPEGPWLTDTTPPPAAGTPSPTSGTPVSKTPSIQSAYQAALMQLLTGGNQQSLSASPALKAFRGEAGRAEARDRAFAAERAAASGYSGSGGFETELAGLRQNRNRDVANFAGAESQRLDDANRQQLMQALALAATMGDNEAARELQRMLTMRGQDFSREAARDSNFVQGRQVDLGESNLGYNYAALQNQMNQQALQYLFGGG
jgi:hypothetical protein